MPDTGDRALSLRRRRARSRPSPRASARHCYCHSCRVTHASGVVTWIGFKQSQVRIAKGAELVRDYESSPGTLRKFCTRCGNAPRLRVAARQLGRRVPPAAGPLRDARRPRAFAATPSPGNGPNGRRSTPLPMIEVTGRGARRRPGQPHGRRGQGTAAVSRQADGGARARAPRAAGGRDPRQCEPQSRGLRALRPPRDRRRDRRLRGPARGLRARARPRCGRAGRHRALRLAIPARATSSRGCAPRWKRTARSSRWRRPASRPTRSSASCAARCTPRCASFLGSGQRKIDRWYASLAVVEVAFDDEADAFLNINTREELASLEPGRA